MTPRLFLVLDDDRMRLQGFEAIAPRLRWIILLVKKLL